MKRFVPFVIVALVASMVVAVPVSASEFVGNRTAYELDEVVSESVKDPTLGVYRVCIGDNDERFTPSPFLARYRFYAGQTTSHQYIESVGHWFPSSTTDNYSPSYTYTFNIYPLGATGDPLYYSVVSTEYLKKGVVFPWTFHYTFGMVNVTGDVYWVPFDIQVEIRFFDSSMTQISSNTFTIENDASFSELPDTSYAYDYEKTAVVNTSIPEDASYFTYRYIVTHAMPDDTFSGQIFFSSEVYVTADRSYQPPEWTITDIVTVSPVPKPPTGTSDVDDVIDLENSIHDSIAGWYDDITDAFSFGYGALAYFASGLGAAVSIFNMFLEIEIIYRFLQFGLMLGIVTVLLNVALTITQYSHRENRKSRKGGSE